MRNLIIKIKQNYYITSTPDPSAAGAWCCLHTVSAFVLSRVDYCNAVLSGLPQSTIAPLQRVLNAAARVVCGLRPRHHVTDALIGLHWLLIAARIEFKLCLLVYNALNGLAPSYISDMLQPVTTLDRQVTLRLADNNDLFISRSCLRLGERAFCIAAPRAWNSLPSDVKSADTVKTFKTFLFSKHYFNIQ